MVAVIDYGAGNLQNVLNAIEYLGFKAEITNCSEKIKAADKLILPGVGAFKKAMDNIEASGLKEIITEEAQKKPFLGICLGMQLLFEKSYEFGETNGLSLIPGEVVKINAMGQKIPHMGWNSLKYNQKSPLTNGIKEGSYTYFVHSYRADCADKYIVAYTEYGDKIPAIVQNNNIFGAQFHPEKSSEIGLLMLKNFLEL